MDEFVNILVMRNLGQLMHYGMTYASMIPEVLDMYLH